VLVAASLATISSIAHVQPRSRSTSSCVRAVPARPRERLMLAKSALYQEHPVVVPQVTHLRQVPLRTMVNWPHSPQGSPS